jgi:hypothetical protein
MAVCGGWFAVGGVDCEERKKGERKKKKRMMR